MVVRAGASGSKCQSSPLGPISSSATGPCHLQVGPVERVRKRSPREPRDVAQPIGGREVDVERAMRCRRCGSSTPRGGSQRGSATTSFPETHVTRWCGSPASNTAAHLDGSVVPPLPDRVAADRAIAIDLRGGRIVDGDRLVLAVAEKPVAELIELTTRGHRRELVRLREVQQHGSDVPPFADASAVPSHRPCTGRRFRPVPHAPRRVRSGSRPPPQATGPSCPWPRHGRRNGRSTGVTAQDSGMEGPLRSRDHLQDGSRRSTIVPRSDEFSICDPLNVERHSLNGAIR